ncbi:MAG: FAD-dependent oxidoreductase [Cyclobacteriaceae bacterium]
MKNLVLSISSGCIIVFFLFTASCEVPNNTDYDVVVYGGTPSGIMASIAAARDGASVVLLEQTNHVGGLSTSGLNRDEGEHMDRSTLGGLCDKFTAEAARRSGTIVDVGNEPRIWQSHIAENVFLDMLQEYNIPVLYEQLLDGVDKSGNTIISLQVQGGISYKAKVFIDATYEGDLMAKAGVSYTMGREALDTYNESKAGVRYMDEKVDVSPFDDEGNLLPNVIPGTLPEEFSASEHPQCYNVRLNLTSEEGNRVPIEKPSTYDPLQYELLARCIQAGYVTTLGDVLGLYGMPNSLKRECNNRQFAYVSMSIPGAQTAWAKASFEERKAIHQQYRNYTHGLLWFLKTDERVTETMRNEMAKYGFCKDEWVDNDHWPWYLYIRAARRMTGEYIVTQHDVTENRKKKDVIHIGSHYIDSHQVARYAVDSTSFINEGRMWQEGMRFDIPYRAITPKREECSNLLVPVCVSASNVAFSAIRLEPTWMHLGEISGIAANLALKHNVSIQEVNVQELQQKISEVGIPLN